MTPIYEIAVNGGAGGKGKPYVIMGAYDTAAELEAAYPTNKHKEWEFER